MTTRFDLDQEYRELWRAVCRKLVKIESDLTDGIQDDQPPALEELTPTPLQEHEAPQVGAELEKFFDRLQLMLEELVTDFEGGITPGPEPGTSIFFPGSKRAGIDQETARALHDTFTQDESDPDTINNRMAAILNPLPLIYLYLMAERDTTKRLLLIGPETIAALLLLWHCMPTETTERLVHPVAALMEAWLLRPEPIQPDNRQTGIIPAILANTPARYSDDTGALFDLSEFEGTQANLPGLSPKKSALLPVLPFLLWDHNIPASRGRGAPYALRLWIEAVLSLPPGQPYRQQEFRIPWGEMVDRTLSGRDNKKNTSRLWQALHTVHNLRLAWGEPGARTGRAAVQVPDIPQTPTEYGATVRFVVELPPGAGNGPLVYKPFLRKIARWSAPAYRAALTLAYLWDQHGTRKGRYIQPTIPRLARDHAGRLINREGQIITAKEGKPIAKYMIGSGRNRRLHPDVLPLDTNGEIVSSIQAAARERNPAADRYPILKPFDLVRLCYPDAQFTREPIKAAARRKRRQRAGQVLQEMAERIYLNIEETPDGWRILPPDGWGAGFHRNDQ